MDAVIREQAGPPADRTAATFAEALSALYATRYTGSVVVHFAEGQPKELQLPQPLTVKLIA